MTRAKQSKVNRWVFNIKNLLGRTKYNKYKTVFFTD